MKINLDKFNGSLPYSSELYGVYQPLLGWKSKRMAGRIEAGVAALRQIVLDRLVERLRPETEISPETLHPQEVRFQIGVAQEGKPLSPLLFDAGRSLVTKLTVAGVERAGPDREAAWERFTSPEALGAALQTIREDVRSEYAQSTSALDPQIAGEARETSQKKLLSDILARESVAAGLLTALHGMGGIQQMMTLINPISSKMSIATALTSLKGISNLIDPRESALARAVISPLGIVHLFRQYFFEFDTFLGTPVEHIWLSPGGTVELIEVSTRRTVVERLVENAFESMERSEKSSSLQDEFSDVVKNENTSNTKFGVSLNTTSAFSAASIFTSQVSTGTSFELDTSQKTSREQLHKGLRQQSEKVASEMKRNFKSSFRTVTEVTDTKSRRYVLENKTNSLMNYEMRRKMRQIGVQIQDYGSHLCWQTYVDNAGDNLGLGNLIHIAVPGDLTPIQQPELPPDPQPFKGETIRINFHWPLGDNYSKLAPLASPAEFFKDYIINTYPIVPPTGFKLDKALVVVSSGDKWNFQGRGISPRAIVVGQPDTTSTAIEVFLPTAHETGLPAPYDKRHIAIDSHPDFVLEVTPEYVPSAWLIDSVTTARATKLKDASEKQKREHTEKLYAAIKERVKLASKIEPRKFEDLREEERILVYRYLIRQLMSEMGLECKNPQLKHVFAEIIQSMFDVDKMLYFVAPEWWVPREIASDQSLLTPGVTKDAFAKSSTVSWGGGQTERASNYFLTEDSAPAKLGSSLGWTIQLDGDNLRNAFLNAPWVKVVIPIRDGKEGEAMEWLSAANVEGSDGLDAIYQPGSPSELPRIREALGLAPGHQITINDAIRYLITRIRQKTATGLEKPRDEDGNELAYLPSDKVYEHGFYPLQGGFKAQGKQPFEVFDQWLEVVPTDQIVPVEVVYDSKTGMQKD